MYTSSGPKSHGTEFSLGRKEVFIVLRGVSNRYSVIVVFNINFFKKNALLHDVSMFTQYRAALDFCICGSNAWREHIVIIMC